MVASTASHIGKACRQRLGNERPENEASEGRLGFSKFPHGLRPATHRCCIVQERIISAPMGERAQTNRSWDKLRVLDGASPPHDYEHSCWFPISWHGRFDVAWVIRHRTRAVHKHRMIHWYLEIWQSLFAAHADLRKIAARLVFVRNVSSIGQPSFVHQS